MSVGADHADFLALFQHAVENAHQHDHAEIGVVPAVDQQRLERGLFVAGRRRQLFDDGFEHEIDADAGLGRNRHGFRGVEADDFLDLGLDAVGLGGGQIDLVEHRHDFVAGVERVIDIGERLGLDALRGVHHQQRAFAGRERTRDLIGEVDVPGRVHQVEDIGLAVLGLVFEANGLRLDGDAALALDIHRIQHLLDHFALGHRAGLLDQPVCERGLAMVDMGDDGEIADIVDLVRAHEAADSSMAARKEESIRRGGRDLIKPASGTAGRQRNAPGRRPRDGANHAEAMRLYGADRRLRTIERASGRTGTRRFPSSALRTTLRSAQRKLGTSAWSNPSFPWIRSAARVN